MKLFTAKYERDNITSGNRRVLSFGLRARNEAEAEAEARRHILVLARANGERNTHRPHLLAMYRFLYIIEETGPDQ